MDLSLAFFITAMVVTVMTNYADTNPVLTDLDVDALTELVNLMSKRDGEVTDNNSPSNAESGKNTQENGETKSSESNEEPGNSNDSKSTAGKHFTFTGTFLNSLNDQQPGVESQLAAASSGGGAFTGSGLFLDKREKLELLRFLLRKDLQK